MKLPINESNTQFLNCQKFKELGLKGVKLKIKDFETQQIKDKQKVVMSLEVNERVLKLPLNQTNMKVLEDNFGIETDNMKGKEITLTLIPTRYNGQPTESLLICA
jgi:hypothetical protein